MAPGRDLQREFLGRVAKSYLKKGSKVYLEGQIQTRKWTDQSGTDRYSTEIVLQKFRGELVLLDSAGGGAGRGAFGEDFGDTGSAPARSQSRPQPAAFDTDLDDDVPLLGAVAPLLQLGQRSERTGLCFRENANFL